jgi:hypothetical protein
MTSKATLRSIEAEIAGRIRPLDPRTASNEALAQKGAYEDCLCIVRAHMASLQHRTTRKKNSTTLPEEVVHAVVNNGLSGTSREIEPKKH